MFAIPARRAASAASAIRSRSLYFSTRSRLVISARPSYARRFEHSGTSKPAQHNRTDFQADWIAPIVPYERVKELTERPSNNVYLIDVREPDEVAQGAIPSSVSIPLSGFVDSVRLSEDQFQQKHGFKKPQLEDEVIFYCRSGVRSASASDIARRNGYKNVLNYKGSWLDWTARNGTLGA